MTREEAIEELKEINFNSIYEKTILATNMAIDALKAMPCEDAISRHAVIELVENSYYDLCSSIEDTWAMVEDVERLPSVTPQYTEEEMQKIQDLEQAEIQKAYELGKEEGQESEVRDADSD